MLLGKFMKRPVAIFIIFTVCALAAVLFWLRVSHYLPLSLWYAALVTPRPDSIGGLIFLYNDLPRLAMAGICGAGLAFSGVVSQQMLRNPLAEPMTLGIASGAYLVLSLVTVFFPVLFIAGREWVAFAGGGLALCFVMLIALRQRTSGVSLILAGMILNLCCSAVGVILAILYFRQLSFMALWGEALWHSMTGAVPRNFSCACCLVLGFVCCLPGQWASMEPETFRQRTWAFLFHGCWRRRWVRCC